MCVTPHPLDYPAYPAPCGAHKLTTPPSSTLSRATRASPSSCARCTPRCLKRWPVHLLLPFPPLHFPDSNGLALFSSPPAASAAFILLRRLHIASIPAFSPLSLCVVSWLCPLLRPSSFWCHLLPYSSRTRRRQVALISPRRLFGPPSPPRSFHPLSPRGALARARCVCVSVGLLACALSPVRRRTCRSGKPLSVPPPSPRFSSRARASSPSPLFRFRLPVCDLRVFFSFLSSSVSLLTSRSPFSQCRHLSPFSVPRYPASSQCCSPPPPLPPPRPALTAARPFLPCVSLLFIFLLLFCRVHVSRFSTLAALQYPALICARVCVYLCPCRIALIAADNSCPVLLSFHCWVLLCVCLVCVFVCCGARAVQRHFFVRHVKGAYACPVTPGRFPSFPPLLPRPPRAVSLGGISTSPRFHLVTLRVLGF